MSRLFCALLATLAALPAAAQSVTGDQAAALLYPAKGAHRHLARRGADV